MARFTEIPSGAIPVMLTPFDSSGAIYYDVIDEMVDFYINSGVSAIFAVCLSSEMFHLSHEERLMVARRVCRQANGTIPVVVSGNFEGSLEEQAANIKAMYDTGADAVIVLLSILPSPDGIPEQLAKLSDLTKIPLGIYECPSPRHIQITAEEISQIAPSGSYVFVKETSSKLENCISKIQAAANTPLKVFMANLRCTPESLKAGGPGHCGIIANVCPELSAILCTDPDANIRDLAHQSAQLMHDTMCACDYLPAAKYILTKRGLDMGNICRSTKNTLSEVSVKLLDETLSRFDFNKPLPTESITELRAMLNRVHPGQ